MEPEPPHTQHIKAFDPDPNLRWLFCMSHPDDEVAIGAWIRRLTRQGNEVWLSWTHDTPIRTSEAKAAAKLLGVPECRLIFHHAPDGRVVEHLANLKPQFTKMLERCVPDRVVTTAFEQGHLDHDATNLLVNSTFNGPVLEFPMYHTYVRSYQVLNCFADPTGSETLELTDDERVFKGCLLRLYPSQTIRRNVIAYGLLHRLLGRPVHLDRTERLRVQTHKDFLTPNLPPSLTATVQNHPTWAKWIAAVRAAGL